MKKNAKNEKKPLIAVILQRGVMHYFNPLAWFGWYANKLMEMYYRKTTPDDEETSPGEFQRWCRARCYKFNA